jgi:hypothetical protein
MFVCSIRFRRKISEKMDSTQEQEDEEIGCLSKWSVKARAFLEISSYFKITRNFRTCLVLALERCDDRWPYCRDASCLCSLAVEISVPGICSEYSFRFAAKYNIKLLTFHNHFVIPTASTDKAVLLPLHNICTYKCFATPVALYNNGGSTSSQKPQNNGGSIPTKTKLNSETSRFLESTPIYFILCNWCASDVLI